MARSAVVAAAFLVLAACGRPPSLPPVPPPAPPSPPTLPDTPPRPPQVSAPLHPHPVTTLDLAHCFEVAMGKAAPDETYCPGFVVEAVSGGMKTCSEAGGRLLPHAKPTAWAVDFDDDGRLEYLFQLGANVDCDGAASVFECGSLGCPVGLYAWRDGAWRGIGAVGEGEPESLEMLASEGPGYRAFRTGCVDEGACPEHALYQWTGRGGYEVRKLEVGDFDVDVTDSPHGLVNLPAGTAVLAAPKADGAVLDRYADGAEVAIRGQAGDYLYVSPCNACRSGFVLKTAVSRQQ